MEEHLVIKLTWKWWFRPYFYTVCFFCWLFQCLPDENRFAYWIGRAANYELVPKKSNT